VEIAQLFPDAVPLFASTVLYLQRVCAELLCFCSKFNAVMLDNNLERKGGSGNKNAILENS